LMPRFLWPGSFAVTLKPADSTGLRVQAFTLSPRLRGERAGVGGMGMCRHSPRNGEREKSCTRNPVEPGSLKRKLALQDNTLCRVSAAWLSHQVGRRVVRPHQRAETGDFTPHRRTTRRAVGSRRNTRDAKQLQTFVRLAVTAARGWHAQCLTLARRQRVVLRFGERQKT
jgi:hypothetical protein